MDYFGLVGSFILGSLVGSFLNVVILRLPKRQSLGGRSHCTSCGHQLGLPDLFPLLSFVFLRGRCRHCKSKISSRYFWIELVTAALFLVAWLFVNPTQSLLPILMLVKLWFACAVLVVIFVIDFEHYLILDNVIFPSLAVILLLNLTHDIVVHQVLSLHGQFILGILSAVVGALPFWLIWLISKGLWMGFGDVKLSLLLGAILLWPQILVGLMLSIMLGGIASVFLLMFSSKTLKSQIPFGTFLSLGTVAALFIGPALLGWYLAILGF